MKKRRKHPESVIRQRPGTCFLCEKLEDDIGPKLYLETHHIIFGTANRIKSEEEGLTVRLCLRHHRMVHKDAELSKKLQAYAQREWEAMPGHTRVEWMRIFHRNYLLTAQPDLDKLKRCRFEYINACKIVARTTPDTSKNDIYDAHAVIKALHPIFGDEDF